MIDVLVACEFSDIVSQAFIDEGYNAWSVDLLPGEGRHGRHIVGDALEVARSFHWDLVIAHPPCTFLANSGVRWLYKNGRGRKPDLARWAYMRSAAIFFRSFLELPVLCVAAENPIMHKYGRSWMGRFSPSQVIQPFEFGHPETKATCLWLKNLPLLQPTRFVRGRKPRVHFASPGPERWKERSRTLPGIARAMARQWGAYVDDIVYRRRVTGDALLGIIPV